ncbi:hypothetical protein Trydic_g21439 [Trypoxylus dichotomus]
MMWLLICWCFTPISAGNYDIPVDIGILYSDEDPLAEVAIKHMEVRFKLVTNYSMNPYLVNIKDIDSFTVEHIVCNMIEKGVYGIVGPTSVETNLIVQSVSEMFELPQLQTFWNPALDESNNNTQVLNLYPEPRMLGKAWATLIKEMHWKSYAVIYEDDESLIRIQEVLKLQRQDADHFPITIMKLLPGKDQSTLLKKIKAGLETHIVLACRTNRFIDILKQAEAINMLEEYRSYVLMCLDAHTLDFSCLENNQANITTFRMIATNKNSVRNVIRDWEFMEEQFQRPIKIDPETVKLSTALLHDALGSFMTTIKELSLTTPLEAKPLSCDDETKSSDGFGIAEYHKRRTHSNSSLNKPLTGTIELDSYGRRTNFKLQVIELDNGQFRQTGEWSSRDPDHIKQMMTATNSTEYLTDINIKKGVIRVAARRGEPYLMEVQNNITKKIQFEGYTVDLIDGISKILNFTYQFYLVPDDNYGSYNPETKEWNGLIKEIIDRKAQLAICDLTITYERGRAVDFSMPFMTLGISILYSKTAKKPQDLLSFMQPLSLDVWMYMATAYLVISIVIYFAARLTPREWESPHPCDDNPSELENVWSIKNTFWLTLGSIMTQGCDILPKGLSTRMIASMWWFFSLIITTSYTANLAAFLTNERMGPTIESAEDLAKQSEISYGCVEGGATATFFRDSNFSTYQRMWRTMVSAEPNVFQKSNKEGVKSVKTRKGMYAFLMESSSLEYERERDCELTQVGGWLDTKGYGIAMPINSPYRTAINEAILRLQENGTLRKLKEKWWKQMLGGGQCNETEHSADDSAAELGIDHVGGVFVVLTGGVILAFLIAIFEFLWNVRRISVVGQMTPMEALVMELKFALRVSDSKKAVAKKKVPARDVET